MSIMKPQGDLTEAQLEVMEPVWAAGESGATVASIWVVIKARRPIARTTVLTMVARLEERGWLQRKADGRSIRYVARNPRHKAVAHLAGRFVRTFFAGSPSALLKSLLGAEPISPEELKRLRALLRERG
jgi:BlaI family transcriptional regulator, penicillinase repressor